MNIEDEIKEAALDYIINTGGLPSTIEDFQEALSLFYRHVIKPITEKEKEQYAKAKSKEVLESLHGELNTKLEYFSDPEEWNQNDSFIRGRKQSFINSKEIVRKYLK